jgi:hypothetical protein
MANYNQTALMDQLNPEDDEQDRIGPKIANTGIGGTPPPVLDQPIAASPLKDAPAAPAPAADYGRLMGYDAGKLNDPNKHDFKYDTARVMSKYDPRGGFTPELLNELTGLGYGTFSSKGGDKLSLTGAKNAKDAADFADQDWIYASKANNDATKWMFGGGGAAPQGGGPGGPAPMHAGGLSGQLTGDPYAGIQAALAQYSNSPNIQELLKQLGAV